MMSAKTFVREANVGEWIYFTPKWYHFKYRGGAFIFARNMSHSRPIINDEKYDIALVEVDKLRIAKKANWEIHHIKRYGTYEVTIVRFANKADALTFKLQWT